MGTWRYTAIAHQAHLIGSPTATFGTIDKAPVSLNLVRWVCISIPNMEYLVSRVVARSICASYWSTDSCKPRLKGRIFNPEGAGRNEHAAQSLSQLVLVIVLFALSHNRVFHDTPDYLAKGQQFLST